MSKGKILPAYDLLFLTPFLYQSDGKLLKGQRGDIIINTPNQIVYHEPRPESEEGFVNDWMHIEGNDIGELLKKYPLPLNKAFHIDEGTSVRNCFDRLLSEYNSEIPGSSDMIESIFTQMIIAMHRADKGLYICNEDFHQVSAVRREIIKNPKKKCLRCRDISLVVLASYIKSVITYHP